MQINTIVVGVDFSEQSEAAAAEAKTIARRAGARLVLVHVGEQPPEAALPNNAAAAQWEEALREQAKEDRKRLESLSDDLADKDVDIDHRVVDGHPDETVCEIAKELGAELVVTGSTGRTGLTRFLLGSVAERIVHLAETNVLVARQKTEDAGSGYDRILVLTDFSRHAERSLQMALALVQDGGTIDLTHYYQLPMIAAGPAKKLASQTAATLGEALRVEVEAEGEKLVNTYKPDRATLRFVAIRDSVMHGIERLRHADPRYDLVAVGSHGHRGFRRLILGSVAEKAMRYCASSVLIVHGTDADHD